jgi:hypothetical protein
MTIYRFNFLEPGTVGALEQIVEEDPYRVQRKLSQPRVTVVTRTGTAIVKDKNREGFGVFPKLAAGENWFELVPAKT